jgi:probable addiction module antidote protein
MKIEQILRHTSDYQEQLIKSLKDRKEAAVYLQVALDEYQQDGNIQALLIALRNITDAQGGISALSKKTHLNRQSLYKTLSRKGNPKLQTLGLLIRGLGFHLIIEPLY